jgi:nitric oxide reductase large subunit
MIRLAKPNHHVSRLNEYANLHWLVRLLVSLILSFSALLYLGGQIYQQAPPIPNAVQIVNGNVIYSKQDIEDGQNIWQTIGGMQQGSTSNAAHNLLIVKKSE